MTEAKQVTEVTELPAHLVEYRKHLVSAEQKSQEDFDKTVLSLSGGALGISFVFLKDVIGQNPVSSPGYLFASWVSWGLSTFAVLLSYYLSQLALRHTIAQVDRGKIYEEQPGGHYAELTKYLNAIGVVLFFFGVCNITYFAYANTLDKRDFNGNQQAAVTAKTTATASAPKSAEATSNPTESKGRQNNGGVHSALPASAASK